METAIDPQSAGLYLGEDIHGNKSGVRLDADHINRCMSVATYNPEIRTCIQYITNRVLSRGAPRSRLWCVGPGSEAPRRRRH